MVISYNYFNIIICISVFLIILDDFNIFMAM